MHEHLLIILTLILVAGVACQWLSWRVRLPSIIFLLLCGILAGPLFNWLNPDQLLGDLLFPLVSLSVAVILFEGSLTLRFPISRGWKSYSQHDHHWCAAQLGNYDRCHPVAARFSWELSFLFGAIMVVTGPTVIMPMIRTVRPKESIAHVLQWEGILIDPIGAILAVLTYEVIVAGGMDDGLSSGMLVFGKILLIGGFSGLAQVICSAL